MFWNQQVETLARADMVVWQNHKINKTIERVYEKSALYSNRMKGCNVKPEDIKTLDDVVALPFTTRQDVADHYPYGLLTMPISGISHVHSSQDVDDLITVVSYTKNDMVMWTELMSRILVSGGLNVTSVFQIPVNGAHYASSLGVHYGARQMGATLVPADGEHVQRQIKLIQDFGVTGVFSTPEYMLALAQEMRQQGIDPEKLPLQVIFCSMGACADNSPRKIQKEYGVQVLEIYGLHDIFGMGIGGECYQADGIHIQEDCFYPEVVHPMSGQVLPVGQIGELVLTSLTLEAMPLIRYRTGIQGYLDDRQCACGRTLVRFKKDVCK